MPPHAALYPAYVLPMSVPDYSWGLDMDKPVETESRQNTDNSSGQTT